MSWPRNPGFKSGDWIVLCDICGFKYYHSQTRKRWDGLTVCHRDWEERHPQELRRSPHDKQSVPDPRPEPDDVFI